MKLTFPDAKTETSAEFKSQNFDIGDKRVILSILRSKMYSNPIATICQEYASNARDAHQEANVTEPIQITLPNKFDLHFKCLDYGFGITPDRMHNVFSKYGNSTKRNNDDEIGGFGLGCKSAFSYTDTFTIVSTTKENDKNTRRTYIAYLDESQLGKIDLTQEEQTEDKTGVQIIIPVKSNDIEEFKAKTISATQWWDPKPNITNPSFKWPQLHAKYSDDKTWAVVDGAEDKKIIIEGIPYRLDLNSVYGSDSAPRIAENDSIVLFFKTNELMVAANRESLDYQPSVIQTIKNKYENILNDILGKVDELLKPAKNLLEANHIANDDNYYVKLLYAIDVDIKWDGIRLDKALSINRKNKVVIYEEDLKPLKLDRYYSSVNIGLTKENFIVENDIEGTAILKSKVNSVISRHPGYERYYFIKFIDDQTRSWVGKPNHWDKFCIPLLSSYPKLILRSNEPRSTNTNTCYKFTNSTLKTQRWAGCIMPPGGLYVIKDGNNALFKIGDENPISNDTLNNYPKKEIFGVTANTYKKIKDNKNFISLYDYIYKELEDLKFDPNAKFTSAILFCNSDLNVHKQTLLDNLPSDHPIIEYINKSEMFSNNAVNYNSASTLMIRLNMQRPNKIYDNDFNLLYQSIMKRYPLLITHTTTHCDENHLIWYIKQCDLRWMYVN